MDALRLALKPLRTEVIALSALLLVVAALFAAAGVGMVSLHVSDCPLPAQTPDCQTRLATYAELSGLVQFGQTLVSVVPMLAAAVLGVALVGREIELRTTQYAWALARSRWRWLLERWVVVAVGLGGLVLLVGLAASYAQGASTPTVELGRSFDRLDARGPILVAQTLAAFALAVVAGALLGRVLPALLVTLGALVLVFSGIARVMDTWAADQAVPIEHLNPADRSVGLVFRDLTTGRLLTADEYGAATPPPGAPAEWLETNFLAVPLMVPGVKAPDYLALEGLLLGVVTVAALGAALVVVERRSPI